MIRRVLNDESGYSLVEVIVSIMLLSIAIIPMVGMFDAGLRAANTGSNYDKVRAFANERLERAKVMSYADVRGNFPVAGSTPGAGGTYTSPMPIPVPASAKLPANSTYTVTKQYVSVPPGVTASLQNSNTDSRMMRLTITVNWSSGNSINVSGVVAGGLT